MDEYARYGELCESIKTLNNKVDAILLKLDAINRDSSKMSGHIDFINKTYDKMSSPLLWMCDKVDSFRGIKSNEALPIRSNIDDQD